MYTENTDESLSVSPLYIDTFQFLLNVLIFDKSFVSAMY